MDNWRLLLAIGISFVIFLAWSTLFGPKPKPPVDAPAQESSQRAATDATPTPAPITGTDATAVNAVPTPTPTEIAAVPVRPVRNITVDTPLFRMTLSEKGATVIGMALHDFRESVAPDAPNKELIPKELSGGTVLVSMTGVAGNSLEDGIYTTDVAGDSISVREGSTPVRFVYTSAQNVQVIKTYRFSADTYLVDLDIVIINGSQQTIKGDLKIGLRDQFDLNAKNAYGFIGPSGLINDHLEQIKFKKIVEQPKVEGTVRWVALEKLYFMDSLICKTPAEGYMALSQKDQTIENQLVLPGTELPAGGRHSVELSLFMGPKSISVLKSVGNQLDRALDFGWVDFIARPCLYFMNFIYKYIPNYGVAIIILTILTRIIFWPLAAKSYKSMNDMRKLQPLMQELREKYKDDKVRLNQETMALYRTYKINPLGGCLPMLIQLPVFFALYRMLYQAIELRHAPFFGWINDLSAPDRLFHFGFKIPFMNEPYGIPVLTLIMGATMLLQQKMTPQAGDPTQAKMMMLMPVVFTFIFINFPSGLVLYWLVGNIVSIAQQYFTQKKAA